MIQKIKKTDRLPRWYFGGIAGAIAAGITHPFDLIKVSYQTSMKFKPSIIQVIRRILLKNDGKLLAFYSGISASLLRQCTYTTTRFGIYELGKPYIKTDHFFGKVLLAGTAGVIGGFVGTPADVVNVRMQSDIKLATKKRRNYKHAIDGVMKIYKLEGITGLFSGAGITSCRGILTTVGQIAFYQQVKLILMNTNRFADNAYTHITASLISGFLSSCITQPFDIVKTIRMNRKPGPKRSIPYIIWETAQLGPKGFYKGFWLSLMRNMPHTVILFLVFEELRLRFGIDPPPKLVERKLHFTR